MLNETKNYSYVLFNEIEKQEKFDVKSKAKSVADAMKIKRERVVLAEAELKAARKRLKKAEKILKKFKKTGDVSLLSKIVG